MTNKIRVLSIFDGIAGARQALKELNIDCDYYASEIDKYAIQVAKANHPDIVQIGDVKCLQFAPMQGLKSEKRMHNFCNLDIDEPTDVRASNIDLLIGGFPCQSFSIAGNRKGIQDNRGQLFLELLRILGEVKPKYFLFENVASMSKKNQAFISEKLGVQPIMINSAKLTAQQRKRLYWTNIPNVDQPYDNSVRLKDVLQDLPDCPIGIKVREKSKCLRVGGRSSPFGSKQEWDSPFQRISKKGAVKNGIEKASCLTGGANSGGNHSDMDILHSPVATRRYSVIECERLQGFPNGYTSMVSNSQAYKALGNSFTVPVIKHILKNIINPILH